MAAIFDRSQSVNVDVQLLQRVVGGDREESEPHDEDGGARQTQAQVWFRGLAEVFRQGV